MVYKWDCRECGYTAWSEHRSSLDEDIKSHLFDHNLDNITKRDFRFTWNCPYCSNAATIHDKQEMIEDFKTHLYRHISDQVISDTHVAETIDRRGNILVEAPVNGDQADYARRHFFSSGNTVVVVTRDPEARIRLLADQIDGWPAQIVVMTTKRRPIDTDLGLDLSDVSIEIVELDQRLGPKQLGETISRVVDEHNGPNRQLSFGFEIIYEIIQSFDLQTSYEFVSSISSRLRDANAVSHFYISPHPQLESILNVLNDQFDLKITVDDDIFRVA